MGADGLDAPTIQVGRLAAARYGFDADRMKHLFSRYGSEVTDLLAVIDDDPSLGQPLKAAPQFLRAEVARACAVEGALHLEMLRGSRPAQLRVAGSRRRRRRRGRWQNRREDARLDKARTAKEKANYRARIAAGLAARSKSTDDAASAARMGRDIVG